MIEIIPKEQDCRQKQSDIQVDKLTIWVTLLNPSLHDRDQNSCQVLDNVQQNLWNVPSKSIAGRHLVQEKNQHKLLLRFLLFTQNFAKLIC